MKDLTRRKKVLFGLITVFFGLTAGAIVGEIGLRIAGPKWLMQQMKGTNLDGTIQYGSDAGWPVETINRKFVRFKPNQTFPVDYYEYHTVVHTDEWGGRVVKGLEHSDRMIVPVLGDSFAFGLGVEDEQSFVSLLNLTKTYRYLNLGVPGSALPNDLDIIEFRHKELGSPKVYVLTFYLGNDYTDVMKYYGYGKDDDEKADSSNTGLHRVIDSVYIDTFLARSYLVQFLQKMIAANQEESEAERRSLRKSWAFRTFNGKRIANSVYLMMSGSTEYEAAVEKYLQQALHRLMSLSQNLHFKSIFVIIPDKHQVDPLLLQKHAKHYGLPMEKIDVSLPNRFLENILEKDGIAYVDTLPCLKGSKDFYYVIDDHLTAAGHQAVARCIADELNQKISAYIGEPRQ